MNQNKQLTIAFESDEMFFKTINPTKQPSNSIIDRLKQSHLKTFMNKENLDLYKSVTNGFYSAQKNTSTATHENASSPSKPMIIED